MSQSMDARLMIACYIGQLDEIKHLIASGINIYEKTSNGVNLLELASQQGHINVVEYLINKPYDELRPFFDWGQRSIILNALIGQHFNLANLLINNKKVIKFEKEHLNHILEYSIYTQNEALVKNLLDLSIDPYEYTIDKSREDIKENALLIAIKMNNENIVQLILNKNHFTPTQANLNESLDVCLNCSNLNNNIAKLLILNGAELKDCDNEELNNYALAIKEKNLLESNTTPTHFNKKMKL